MTSAEPDAPSAPLPPSAPRPPRRRLLTFTSGGWVLALAAFFCLGALAWRLNAICAGFAARRAHPAATPGDPLAAWDLSDFAGAREALAPSGLPAETLPPLDSPALWRPEDVERFRREERGKYLVPGDLVTGLALGGEARAWPHRVLNWHEISNDSLGGAPVLVVFSPLAWLSAAWDRRVDSETLEFRLSGLMYQSRPLLRDRRADARESSLWDPFTGRAVAGPAARRGARLRNLPVDVVPWGEWAREHPETTVPAPRPEFRARYKKNPYGGYLSEERLLFPVAPAPAPPRKTPLLILGAGLEKGGARISYSIPDLLRRADARGRAQIESPFTEGERALEITVFDGDPPTARARFAGGEEIPEVLYTLQFTWTAESGAPPTE